MLPLRIAAVAVSLIIATPVLGADDAVTKANRDAYTHAIRCFLANGYASDERRKAGDATKASTYDLQSRKSFDLAYAAGNKIGLSDARIGRDLDYYQSIELPRFIREAKYLLGVASTCKALGLM